MVSNALNIDSTFGNKKLISLCNRKINGIGFHNIHHLSYTAVILRLKAYGSYGRFVMQSIPYYWPTQDKPDCKYCNQFANCFFALETSTVAPS